MSFCDANWPAVKTCPDWDHPFHGCVFRPGHKGPHECKCGSTMVGGCVELALGHKKVAPR